MLTAQIGSLKVPHALQMALAPQQSATKRLLSSDLLFVPLALLYLYLLVHSWEPDTLRLILPGSLADGLKGALCTCLEPADRGVGLCLQLCSLCAHRSRHIVGWCCAGGFRPQFLPSLSGVMLLFSRMVTAASLWVHILAINLYAARTAYLQGTQGPAFLPYCFGTRKRMY